MAEKYMKTVRVLTPAKKTEELKKIEESYAKARELADDKVQLAMQTYEMVSFGASKSFPSSFYSAGVFMTISFIPFSLPTGARHQPT